MARVSHMILIHFLHDLIYIKKRKITAFKLRHDIRQSQRLILKQSQATYRKDQNRDSSENCLKTKSATQF